MAAIVGWSREAYNVGAWNTSPDALAVINGISSNALLNNAVVTASAPFSINGLLANITVGQVNAGASVFLEIESFQANTSTGTVSTGEGREVTILTAGELTTDLNLGFGWSREEWNVGAWNDSLGFVFTGNGDVFSITTAGQLNTNLSNVTTTGTAPITILGEELNISQGIETVTGTAHITIIGEELLSATVNTFAVSAGGAITINTPTFEANVELSSNLVIGTASFLNIVGQELTTSLATIIPNSENIIDITGQELTLTANTIAFSTDQILSITGNQVTVSAATIIPNSNNFLSITGNQANVDVNTIQFWNPILPTITEEWTNIH